MAVRAYALLIFALATTHALIDEAVDVLKLGLDIGEQVVNSWDVISKPLNISGGVELPFIRKKERQILSRLNQVSRAIKRLELSVERNGAFALLIAQNAGRGARLELKLHEMADLLSRVASLDRQMREYMRIQQDLERNTLEDFAASCVSHDTGALPSLLERVHSLVSPPHSHLLGRGILQLLLNDLQVCRVQITPVR